MSIRLLLVAILILYNCLLTGQVDSISPASIDDISTATLKTKAIHMDLANPEEVDLAFKKIHTLKYLESIVLDGETDDNTLRKLFYRLSVLKNLSSLTLRENQLTTVPDNIAGLKSLRSLTVEGNVNLDYDDLFSRLKTVPLTQLILTDNDLRKAPATISGIGSLKKVQLSGSNLLDYTGFVDELAKLPGLSILSIAVNYITELPKNIDKLRALQILDVSNNNLTELPGEISGLKAINNLSIQGNLLIDLAADLEKLKGNNIQYLSLDREISGDDLEIIKKMFPAAQIDFPVSLEEKEADEARKAAEKPAPVKPVYKGELKAKKETVILSGAYLLYPTLFQSIVYNFDTLNFEERYRDLRYENIYQMVGNRGWRGATLYLRKNLMYYEKKGQRHETWFRFSADQMTSINYPELRAFSGMYWVYKGPLTKKQFKKKYLVKRQQPDDVNWLGRRKRKQNMIIRWNDVRINFDKNNSLFRIVLKNDTGFSEFTAYPVIPDIHIEKSQQTYYRRFLMYEKSLQRRAQRFKREYTRNKTRYDLNFRKMKEYAWKELQLRMSDDEKGMSVEEWLQYYDALIANEQAAIDNSSLSSAFITRGLLLRGYRNTGVTTDLRVASSSVASPRMVTLNNYGFKTVNVDFVDAKGTGKLAVANIYILDNKNKSMSRITGTLGLLPNAITLQQFASYSILVELRNGNWGVINPEEMDRQVLDPNKTYQFSTQLFDKNLDTIGDLLKSGTR